MIDAGLAAEGAALLLDGWDGHRRVFAGITRRAPRRFAERDWRAGQNDALERLDLHRASVAQTVRRLEDLLGASFRDRAVWRSVRSAFDALPGRSLEPDQAETFFNSVTRRVFSTVGLDPEIDFVRVNPPLPAAVPGGLLRSFPGGGAGALETLLSSLPVPAPFESLSYDARALSAEIDRELHGASVIRFEVVPALFYRNRAAYVVGHVLTVAGLHPLVIALLHGPGGVFVDAVLLTSDEASLVFSFTRSYFHVDVERPTELVGLLKELMPRKPVADLYTSIGLQKHGKTVFYRDLLAHLSSTDERFQSAPGERGLVMAVFAMPGWDAVFKVIRDDFGATKSVTREDVVSRYRLVSTHDRAGRLVDAQEFEHLSFDRRRFDDAILEEVLRTASRNVSLDGDRVVVRHGYTERRLVPLNLHLARASEEEGRRAILDFGQAIRDLASTNIFPGDVLPKNFGVTRHGRVVFYDYDELAPLLDVVFRELPQASSDEDEMRAEPWYWVGEKDVFPEEFLPFLGIPKAYRETFLEAHGELLTPGYWQGVQERLRAGEVLELFPYPVGRRLPRPANAV